MTRNVEQPRHTNCCRWVRSHLPQALEGAVLAPSTRATLDILRDPSRRPNLSRETVLSDVPEGSSRMSGMTTEHLRTTLGSLLDTHLLFRAGELLARAQVPNTMLVDSPLCANQTVASERNRRRRRDPPFGGQNCGTTVGTCS